MKKTAMEVYALAVCFVTVGCFVIALGIGLYGLLGVATPGFTMSTVAYDVHQTNEEFFARHEVFPPIGEPQPSRPRPPEAELTRQRLASFERALSIERRSSGQTAVKAGIVVLIDLLVFFAHWSIARRSRHAAGQGRSA